MAKFTTEIMDSKMIKTLEFNGKKFINTWVPNKVGMTTLEKAFEFQVKDAFPNIDDYALEQVEQLTFGDEDEIQEAISELSDYESEDE